MKTKKIEFVIAMSVVLMLIALLLFIGKDHILAEICVGNPVNNPLYVGVLSVPSVNIDLPCIGVEASDYRNAKLAIDKTKCAAKIWYPVPGYRIESSDDSGIGSPDPGMWIIGDHSSQGFNKIENCELNDTAFFTNPDGHTTEYYVADMFPGYVQSQDVFNDKDTSIVDNHPDDIILMTCYNPRGEYSENGIPITRFFVYLKPTVGR